MLDCYDDPVQMEPPLPDGARPKLEPLIGLAHELSESLRMPGCHAPSIDCQEPLAARSGHELLLQQPHRGAQDPANRHREGLLHRVVEQSGQSALQSLARAHIEADRWARQQSLGKDTRRPFLLEVRRRFGLHLSAHLLALDDGSMMVPGELRTREVSVGRHRAPRATTLGRFLDHYANVYSPRLAWAKRGGIPRLDGIVASSAAHHRLAWNTQINPFLDGNGRVARITLDAMLRECGLNSAGLWSISRGFAKTADEYKARLAGADEHRKGDLDGRGNLSEQGLAEFCTYALQAAIDQAGFISRLSARPFPASG